jgi:hypothetical protein
MQVKKTTYIAIVVAALLLLVPFNVVVFAQVDDEEGEGTVGTIVGSIYAEDSNQTQTYRDVENTEVIDNDGNVVNPGGAGNENITLSELEMQDDEIDTPATNLDEVIAPQTVPEQNFEDLRTVLLSKQYAMADMKRTEDFVGQTTQIVVVGVEGIMDQPDRMTLEEAVSPRGYTVESHFIIDNAWQTILEPVIGN